jgi:hypothetical protein
MHGELALREARDADMLETELQAHAFSQQCLREMEAKDRHDRAEHVTTEVLEVIATSGAGALSTWKTKGGFPIGATLNYVLGAGAKAVSIWNPEHHPGLRVAGRTGKVLLQSQLSITTRNLILETP